MGNDGGGGLTKGAVTLAHVIRSGQTDLFCKTVDLTIGCPWLMRFLDRATMAAAVAPRDRSALRPSLTSVVQSLSRRRTPPILPSQMKRTAKRQTHVVRVPCSARWQGASRGVGWQMRAGLAGQGKGTDEGQRRQTKLSSHTEGQAPKISQPPGSDGDSQDTLAEARQPTAGGSGLVLRRLAVATPPEPWRSGRAALGSAEAQSSARKPATGRESCAWPPFLE